MNLILTGLIFLVFNVKSGQIALLPAFAGYILIILGMRKYPTVLAYKAAAPAALIGAVVEGGFWLSSLELLHFHYRVNLPADVVGMCIQLFVTWQLAQGMWELEIQRKTDLGAAALRKNWTAMAAGVLLALVLTRSGSEPLAKLSPVVGIAAALLFTAAFYKSKKWLDKAPEAQPPEAGQPEKKG